MVLAIFDLDNTLIDRAAAFRRWAAGFVADHGLDPAETAWLEAADGDGYTPREQFLSAVRSRYALRPPVESLVRTFRAEVVAHVALDPRVPAALDSLRAAGWKIAIASNGSTAQQRAKLTRTGLLAHVDAVAISEEAGVAKPDPRLFTIAAERCGERLTPETWMTGDCPTRDIAAAQALGLRTAWIHRNRPWRPDTPPPDATAADAAAACAVVEATSR